MRGDSDYLQRRQDAAGRPVRARWRPACSNVLAVLSEESVRYREEELRLQQLMDERAAREDPAALASYRAALAARRSLTIPSV